MCRRPHPQRHRRFVSLRHEAGQMWLAVAPQADRQVRAVRRRMDGKHHRPCLTELLSPTKSNPSARAEPLDRSSTLGERSLPHCSFPLRFTPHTIP
ncbi:uncharacterized protein EKO05_0000407 [Ascochyta rabiei]|uniref:uncharacterized protein n=1 Tax=Didymella rabiei TaxID=5454 RepID=UPI0021FE2F58|nr:uncharacterized protein EKO05_0000407 [Ascochyta rabiei]UPX09723.1 hypothetical protein EKO05_0000407 [Ascochyta rabiei]